MNFRGLSNCEFQILKRFPSIQQINKGGWQSLWGFLGPDITWTEGLDAPLFNELWAGDYRPMSPREKLVYDGGLKLSSTAVIHKNYA